MFDVVSDGTSAPGSSGSTAWADTTGLPPRNSTLAADT